MKKTITMMGILACAGLSLRAQEADTIKTKHLEEVSVVANRANKKTPMSYGNIKKSEIRKANLGQDIPYLLTLQPSVVVTSDAGTGLGYTGIRVRGVDATGTNVTANGVPVNDSESQGVFWVNMPDLASSVDEMQLQRGVGTSSNGAGSFGASLNLQTNKFSQKAYGEVGISGGSFGTFRRNVRIGTGLLGGHWSADLRLSEIDSKGYVDRASIDLKSYFVQLAYLNSKSSLRFISFGGKEVTGIAWHGISQSNESKYGRKYNQAGDMFLDGTRYYHNTDNYQQQHNHLIFSHQANERLSIGLTAHYTKGFGYTDEYRTGRKPSEYAQKIYKNEKGKEIKRSLIRRKYLDNHFGGLIANLHYKGKKLDLTFGFSGNYYKGLHYGEIRWIEASFPDRIEPTDKYYDSWGKKFDFSAYAKANYQLTNNLSAYADLQYRGLNYKIKGIGDGYSQQHQAMQRLDINQDFNFFNPKVGLFWQIATKHHTYVSVAMAHREPNRKMYTDVGEDTALPKAEQLTDYELGYAYRDTKFSFSTNLYYMKYQDQLVASGKWSDVGEALLTNIPNSYRLGLELSLAYSPIQAIRFDGSLAISKNRVKNYTHYIWDQAFEYSQSPIAYSPSIVGSSAVTFKCLRNVECSLTLQHVGKQYLDNTGNDDRSLPAYILAGLRLAYERPLRGLLKTWSINLQINNLLNKTYHSNAYVYDISLDGNKQISDIRTFPQAGINFLLGTTLSF